MFARRLISCKACRAARSENASRPLVLVYRERCVRLYVIFIALEIMESELTFYDDNFCKFHVLYACTGDACALETRWRFVTERGRKKKKKESRNFNPGLTAWVTSTQEPWNLVESLSFFLDWHRVCRAVAICLHNKQKLCQLASSKKERCAEAVKRHQRPALTVEEVLSAERSPFQGRWEC